MVLWGSWSRILANNGRGGVEGSTHAMTSSRTGTVAGFGSMQYLLHLFGPDHSMESLFAAEPIGSEHGPCIGLPDRRPPAGEAHAETKRMAVAFAERRPLSLAFAKRAVMHGMHMDLASTIEFEFYLVSSIYGTAVKQEGMSVFFKKRKAQFSGR